MSTSTTRISPMAARFIAAGHAARVPADATLGDRVPADKPSAYVSLRLAGDVCSRAALRRDCPRQHSWEPQYVWTADGGYTVHAPVIPAGAAPHEQ